MEPVIPRIGSTHVDGPCAACFVGQPRALCDSASFYDVLLPKLGRDVDVYVVVPRDSCEQAQRLFPIGPPGLSASPTGSTAGVRVRSVRCLIDDEMKLTATEWHFFKKGPNVNPGRKSVLHALRYRKECLKLLSAVGRQYHWVVYSRLDVIWRRFPALSLFSALATADAIWTMRTEHSLWIPGVPDKCAVGQLPAMRVYLSMLDWLISPRSWWLLHPRHPIAHFWDFENQTVMRPHVEIAVETYLRLMGILPRVNHGICLEVVDSNVTDPLPARGSCTMDVRQIYWNKKYRRAPMCEDGVVQSASGVWQTSGEQLKVEAYSYDGPFAAALATFLHTEQSRFGRPITLLEAGCGYCSIPYYLATWAIRAKGFDGNDVALRRPNILDEVMPQRDLTNTTFPGCSFKLVLTSTKSNFEARDDSHLEEQCCQDGGCTGVAHFAHGPSEVLRGWSPKRRARIPVAVKVKFANPELGALMSDWVLSVDVADAIRSGNASDSPKPRSDEKLRAWLGNLHAWNRHGMIITDVLDGRVQQLLLESGFSETYMRDRQAEARLRIFAGVHGSGGVAARSRARLLVLRRRAPPIMESCNVALTGDGTGAEVYCVPGVTFGCVDASTIVLTGGCGGTVRRDDSTLEVACNGDRVYREKHKSLVCHINASFTRLLVHAGLQLSPSMVVPTVKCARFSVPSLTLWVTVPGMNFEWSFEQQWIARAAPCMLWQAARPKVLAKQAFVVIIRVPPKLEKRLCAEALQVAPHMSGKLVLQLVLFETGSILAQTTLLTCFPAGALYDGDEPANSVASTAWWGRGVWDPELSSDVGHAYMQLVWEWGENKTDDGGSSSVYAASLRRLELNSEINPGFGLNNESWAEPHFRGSLCTDAQPLIYYKYGENLAAFWDRADLLVPVPKIIWEGCELSALYVRAFRSALSGPQHTHHDGDFGELEWSWLLSRYPWTRPSGEQPLSMLMFWLLQALEARAWSRTSSRVTAHCEHISEHVSAHLLAERGIAWETLQDCPKVFASLADVMLGGQSLHEAVCGWDPGVCIAQPVDFSLLDDGKVFAAFSWSTWGTYLWRVALRGLDVLQDSPSW